MKDTPEIRDLLRGMRHELKDRFIPVPVCPVFRAPPENPTLIFVFCWQFRVPVGVKYEAKTGLIVTQLRAILRGRFQPNFAKRGNFQAYFPHELKMSIIRGFPGLAGSENRDRSPIRGYFPRGEGLFRTMVSLSYKAQASGTTRGHFLVAVGAE